MREEAFVKDYLTVVARAHPDRHLNDRGAGKESMEKCRAGTGAKETTPQTPISRPK